MSNRTETVGLAEWGRKEGLFEQTHRDGKAEDPCDAAEEVLFGGPQLCCAVRVAE